MKILLAISITLLTLLSGCATKEQFQAGLNDIDAHWGKTNAKILAEKGIRTFPACQQKCLLAAKNATMELGFSIEKESSNSLTGKASGPTPFTEDEYKEIRAVEEPMMQAAAADHVGGFWSSFFKLQSGKSWVIIDVYVSPNGTSKTDVRVSFRIQQKEVNPNIIVGNNAPSEAVRKGLDKWWSAFDKNMRP